MNISYIIKGLGFGPLLAGYMLVTNPAHAAADPIGDIIAAHETAKVANRVAAEARAALNTSVSADDKRDALSYIEWQLRVTDPNCHAFDVLVEYRGDLLSGELERSAAEEMASLWRSHVRAERRAQFAAAFGN